MGGKRRKRGRRTGGMSQSKKMYLERAGYCNRHHMTNKIFGGKVTDDNMILLDERRHSAFHLLFHHSDFLQAARILLRTHNLKKGTTYEIV
jgi:hypothetical protein